MGVRGLPTDAQGRGAGLAASGRGGSFDKLRRREGGPYRSRLGGALWLAGEGVPFSIADLTLLQTGAPHRRPRRVIAHVHFRIGRSDARSLLGPVGGPKLRVSLNFGQSSIGVKDGQIFRRIFVKLFRLDYSIFKIYSSKLNE